MELDLIVVEQQQNEIISFNDKVKTNNKQTRAMLAEQGIYVHEDQSLYYSRFNKKYMLIIDDVIIFLME